MSNPKKSFLFPLRRFEWFLIILFLFWFLGRQIWEDSIGFETGILILFIGATWYHAWQNLKGESLRDYKIQTGIMLFTLLGFAAFIYLISVLWERGVL